MRAALSQVQPEGKRVWRGSVGKREVLVVTGGVGPRRTQQTLERFTDVPFAAVLSVGCAGALIPGLATGQLVLAPDVRMRSAEPEAQLERFPLDVRLLAYARAAASQAAITGPLSFGTPFSILCALSLVSFVVGPFAAAASLRHGLD